MAGRGVVYGVQYGLLRIVLLYGAYTCVYIYVV